MKVREILKIIRGDGWFIVRQNGSHRQFHHPIKAGTVTVAGKPGKTLHPKVVLDYAAGTVRGLKIVRCLVKIYRHNGDYSAMVPDLPGCVAAADSVEEVRDLITEAIRLHLDLMRKHKEAIPKPGKHFDLNVDDLEDEELCTWVEVKRKQRV